MNDTKQTKPPKKKSISYSYAKRHGVVITTQENGEITVIHRSTLKPLVIAELRRYLQCPFTLQEVNEEEFNRSLTQTYKEDSSIAMLMAEGMEEEMDLQQLIHTMPKSEDLLESQDEAPVIRLLNAILTEAIRQKASDVHIETFENNVIVRFRIDGVLKEALELQRVLSALIISRIKVMAKLDIAEKRLPQDGRITLRIAGHTVDVRVSTLPSSHAERVVMRLLDKSVARLDLALLGMDDDILAAVNKLIAMPHGIILVTGPTGSGKTTSLYAMLTALNDKTRNILTVEDPIEYDLPGVGQTKINPKIEMTFAKGLRAILRQDPDIIMVGEIRDLETAEIAIQASLTGHLVFSTLHTNTAVSTITRLIDMSTEPFLLSSSLVGIIAQRLVRLLCEHCKKPRLADPQEAKLLKVRSDAPPTLYDATGCEKCSYSGYQGRTGIYEILSLDDSTRKLIHNQASEQEIEVYVRKSMPSITTIGFRRVLDGKTTLEEILRVTSEE